jgi:hypothetical protein
LPALSEEQHGPSVKFQAMCEAFDGSADLYSNYRHRCGYTHAGVPLASWLVFDSTDPDNSSLSNSWVASPFSRLAGRREPSMILSPSRRDQISLTASSSVHSYLRGYESRIRFRLSLDQDCARRLVPSDS